MIYHWHDRVSPTDKLLTRDDILQLKDGDIVFVQWPNEEGAAPWRIQTRQYDRPYVYATDLHPYHSKPCLWHREISGEGPYKPGVEVFALRVWLAEEPPMPETEDGEEIFKTIHWKK